MSRFLTTRHYKLTLPGIALLLTEPWTKHQKLSQVIMVYLDQTKVNYTMKDVAEIQTLHLQRYQK